MPERTTRPWRRRGKIALSYVGWAEDPRTDRPPDPPPLTSWRAVAPAAVFAGGVTVGTGVTCGVGYALLAALIFGMAILLISGSPVWLLRRWPNLSDGALPVASVMVGIFAFDQDRSNWDLLEVYLPAGAFGILVAVIARRLEPGLDRPADTEGRLGH